MHTHTTAQHLPPSPTARFTLGVDLAKGSLVACLLDHAGNQLAPPTPFDTTPAGLRKLVAWLKDPAATRVVFESTGVYGKPLILALDGVVASLHQLNPRIIKRRADSSVQTKTDQADARAIARVGHDLALTSPKTLENSRVRFDPAMENLAAWLTEFHRVSRRIAELKVHIQTVECNPAPAAKAVLKRLAQELKSLQEGKKHVAREMDGALNTAAPRQAELLESIPGIGPATAAALTAKLLDIRRFASADALKGYLGIYPRRIQSGAYEARSRMATHGSAIVRHMLWNCAKVAARFNPVCKALYERLKARGKHAASCYGAVARKLVEIVYAVLANNTPFDHTKYPAKT